MGGIPYVLAGPTAAAGFLFGYPLKAGSDAVKVLWVVSTPRNNAPLEIQAHPSGSSEPVVQESRPADSGPGEIYPDGVPVPTASCWHFSLQWATGHAELDLLYST
ncbi:MAG: hypothetical protein ACR2MZ_05120 [Candidatus Dormibacter sp.]|uniref:hypothetical protein n=1 Tax=Candidatus Dormibacter sp. TaxID=2973982 RepID=UPI000DAF73EC|nr:MAG: hypothetical protein DLM66_15510 [Candidatus Dormibacteraeota bacterium]